MKPVLTYWQKVNVGGLIRERMEAYIDIDKLRRQIRSCTKEIRQIRAEARRQQFAKNRKM